MKNFIAYSSDEFYNLIPEYIKLIKKATGLTEERIEKHLNLIYFRKIDLRVVIVKIKESNFLSGNVKLLHIGYFTEVHFLEKIIDNRFVNMDSIKKVVKPKANFDERTFIKNQCNFALNYMLYDITVEEITGKFLELVVGRDKEIVEEYRLALVNYYNLHK